MQFSTDITLEILQKGELAIKGEFLWGSNYTFLAEARHKKGALSAVYKPTRGVRPLWDFPNASLARRETAAYLVSEALGWQLVPPTVLRRKGPLGAGSLQLFIEHDPEYHYFNFTEEDRQRLRPVVMFDLLLNNADRKGSHILLDPERHLWLIDHGLCFHVEEKLRTVIWDFVDEPFPTDLMEDVSRFEQDLKLLQTESSERNPGENLHLLRSYLSEVELEMLAQRSQDILTSGRFPAPDPARRQFPWPQL